MGRDPQGQVLSEAIAVIQMRDCDLSLLTALQTCGLLPVLTLPSSLLPLSFVLKVPSTQNVPSASSLQGCLLVTQHSAHL